jgi:antitoxin component YwqK of YwqJK toxin-antitoxin module
MEKIVIGIGFILIAASCSDLENTGNDLGDLKLKGRVRLLKAETFEAEKIDGKVIRGTKILNYSAENDHIIFNENGFMVEQYYYKPDGSLNFKNTYEYNENMNKTEKKWIKPDGSFSGKRIYKYDENGNMIEEKSENTDNSTGSKHLYTYDENGLLIEKSWFESYGDIYSNDIYKYDENGNMVEENSYNSDGSLNYRFLYRYDKNGMLVERDYYQMERNIRSKSLFYYDENGNVIKEKKSSSDWFSNKEFVNEYKYDKNKNWIKKTTFKDGELDRIVERIIEYY